MCCICLAPAISAKNCEYYVIGDTPRPRPHHWNPPAPMTIIRCRNFASKTRNCAPADFVPGKGNRKMTALAVVLEQDLFKRRRRYFCVSHTVCTLNRYFVGISCG